ncbi:hypothetical protein Tsubulata_017135, partial [Turnera subulata]
EQQNKQIKKSTTNMNSPPYPELAKQEEETFSYAMQLACGSVLPTAMKTAIELGFFDIIAKVGAGAKLSAMDIAAELPTNNPDAPIFISRRKCYQASRKRPTSPGGGVKLFNGIQTRLYFLLPVAKCLAPDDDGVSLGPMLTFLQDKAFMESWPALKDSILEGGIAFHGVHGMSLYEYPNKDPRFGRLFDKFLINHSTKVIRKLLESYKGFEQVEQLIDIGGGSAVTLNIITSKYPQIKGVNFDLPR